MVLMEEHSPYWVCLCESGGLQGRHDVGDRNWYGLQAKAL